MVIVSSTLIGHTDFDNHKSNIHMLQKTVQTAQHVHTLVTISRKVELLRDIDDNTGHHCHNRIQSENTSNPPKNDPKNDPKMG